MEKLMSLLILDMFDKMFNEKTISTKGLNKIFGSSKDGQN